MKILITGANGMVGSSLIPILKQRNHEVHPTDIIINKNIEALDVRNYGEINKFFGQIKPDIVIHLAAETDVDKCELDPDHAYRTNTMGTMNIVLFCQKYNIPLLYVSTIGVFDGNKLEPYTEFDNPNPINIYGKSKLEGEKIVIQLLKKFYIVRAGWMVGGGPDKDKKFVGKIIRILQNTNTVNAVDDKIGSPTFTADLSTCISDLIETGYYGIFHCTNRGIASRYEIAQNIALFLGKDTSNIKPAKSALFPLPAPRARSEASINYKLDLMGLNKMRHWKVALKEYIEDYWKPR
ncbi:MAG: dTDP-4-dehydrorhamnose reductase [Nitrososphaerota archaeon]|nr:dTDP-4-dehydrorhamnose reductase [Nitrososphaerota archaeon]